MTADALPPERAQWIERIAGARIVSVKRAPGGASRETYLIDASKQETPLGLVLRLETGHGAHAGTSFSLAREHEVYTALADSAAPTPRVYGLADDGQALLLERLAGTGDFSKLSEPEQRQTAHDFMRALAALHRLDASSLSLPSFAYPASAEDHARIEISRWRALAETRTSNDEPLLHYALAWLDRFAPAQVQRTCLVQGDTGPGNFMAAGGRVTGLIDWEFSHIGDPMTDFGWLQVRCRSPAHYERFAEAFAAYEAQSGLVIDAKAVAYHRAFALVRCAITVAMAMRSGGALSPIQYRIGYHDYLRRTAAALLILIGQDPTPAAAPLSVESSAATIAAAELDAHVIPRLADRRARLAAFAARSALKHAALKDAHGARLAEEDRLDRAATVHLDEDLLVGRAAESGAAADAIMLAYLARRAERQAMLWRFD